VSKQVSDAQDCVGVLSGSLTNYAQQKREVDFCGERSNWSALSENHIFDITIPAQSMPNSLLKADIDH